MWIFMLGLELLFMRRHVVSSTDKEGGSVSTWTELRRQIDNQKNLKLKNKNTCPNPSQLMFLQSKDFGFIECVSV